MKKLSEQSARYERQILLPSIGQAGQEKLRRAHVAVIGAGGLGSPVLTYLACAGVGKLTVIDADTVSETNLNRQFLHRDVDIGVQKAVSAMETIRALNEEVQIIPMQELLTLDNGARLIQGADVVVDCVDNVETRMVVNDSCLEAGIPFVEGGLIGFYGFVMSVCRESPCLRCIGYEGTSVVSPVPVIGATAGVIGSLQANECIKILLGLEGILYGSMVHYDGMACTLDKIEVSKDKRCPFHGGAVGQS